MANRKQKLRLFRNSEFPHYVKSLTRYNHYLEMNKIIKELSFPCYLNLNIRNLNNLSVAFALNKLNKSSTHSIK